MKPTATQAKAWLEQIARYSTRRGTVVEQWTTHVQLHHVVGRSYIHNKVHIGHWFVIPVPFHLHDVSSNNPDNVTHYPKNFVKKYGKQCGLWWTMCRTMLADGEVLPFTDDVVKAILDTNK